MLLNTWSRIHFNYSASFTFPPNGCIRAGDFFLSDARDKDELFYDAALHFHLFQFGFALSSAETYPVS